MALVTNYDLFEDLFHFIKQPDIDISDVIKEHGGSSLQIQSYKTTFINNEIYEEYKERLVKKLAKKYEFNEHQIFFTRNLFENKIM